MRTEGKRILDLAWGLGVDMRWPELSNRIFILGWLEPVTAILFLNAGAGEAAETP
jgi:hypothetical protein